MSPRVSISDVFLRTQSDERLFALAADGHERAFTVLMDRHHGALGRTASRLVGPGRAEDVVQETLMRAWAATGAGNEVRNVSAWLHQIARNTAYTHLAREPRGSEEPTELLADPRWTDGSIEQRVAAHELLRRISELPEHQRDALLRTELEGQSRRHIASDLGVTEGAVRQLVHRARTSVRAAMTAVTPYPLAIWLVRRAPGVGVCDRLAPNSDTGRLSPARIRTPRAARPTAPGVRCPRMTPGSARPTGPTQPAPSR